MKEKVSITRLISEVAIFAAIGFILDEIQGVIAVSFTSGGSIGIAMVAVLIIAYRRGLLPALLTGLIMGLLDFATKAYLVHPMQVFLDYIFPYMLVGLAGLLKPLFDKTDNRRLKIMWLIIGTLFGGVLKFFSHYFAGLYFWGDPAYFAWNLNYMSPALYSFIYNIAYTGPCIILSSIVLVVLFLKAPKIIMTTGEVNDYVVSVERKNKVLNYSLAGLLIGLGTFLFVFYLIKYAQSYYYKASSQKFTFDKDCMVAFLIGFALLILGAHHIFVIIKGKIKLTLLALVLSIISLISSGYALARILDMYIDVETPIQNLYWAWFIPSFVLAGVLLATYIVFKKKNHQKTGTISAS